MGEDILKLLTLPHERWVGERERERASACKRGVSSLVWGGPLSEAASCQATGPASFAGEGPRFQASGSSPVSSVAPRGSSPCVFR